MVDSESRDSQLQVCIPCHPHPPHGLVQLNPPVGGVDILKPKLTEGTTVSRGLVHFDAGLSVSTLEPGDEASLASKHRAIR